MKDLSELEGAVLGVVGERIGCTAYGVRKVFKESPVHHWQASAGAIYPVVERLKQAGLLASTSVARGRQKTEELSVTARGQEAMRAWLCGHSDRLGVPPDPLRTRIFFFSKLSPEERSAMLTKTLRELEAEMAVLEADCNAHQQADRFAHLASSGALSVARARSLWIEQMIRVLSKEP